MIINLDTAQKVDFKNQRRLFDFTLKFRRKTAEGVVIDITGWKYEMLIYKGVASATPPLLKIDDTNFLTVVSNQVIIEVPGAELTLAVGSYNYLIKRTKTEIPSL
ncbi:MAG: hypothetical protein IPP48_03495 [Chitinophagaceae bacterium]|nr:hypothetical protein [Chitinophagaceae bacterium]